jgi:hypothetical protein
MTFTRVIGAPLKAVVLAGNGFNEAGRLRFELQIFTI